MNLRETLRTSAYALLIAIGLMLTASAQNNNGQIPDLVEQGGTGFTQNQINLDTALGNGLYGTQGFYTKLFNDPAVIQALNNGTIHLTQCLVMSQVRQVLIKPW